jgi:hypothetical protein
MLPSGGRRCPSISSACDQVKVTFIHDDFEPDSTVLPLVSEGRTIKLLS